MPRNNQGQVEPGICYTVEYENDAYIQVGWYNETPGGTPFCDRIHVIIKPDGEEPRGWTMRVQEAEQLITGLKYAIELVKANPMPADVCFSEQEGCGGKCRHCPGDFWGKA